MQRQWFFGKLGKAFTELVFQGNKVGTVLEMKVAKSQF